MDNVRETCLKVMSEIMEVEPSSIHDDSNPDNLPEWDSLSHVQLVLGLEKTFAIEITPEEGIEQFENFRKIIEFIEKRLNV